MGKTERPFEMSSSCASVSLTPRAATSFTNSALFFGSLASALAAEVSDPRKAAVPSDEPQPVVRSVRARAA
ncbi:hypothetical protein D3C86_2185440 [compost metagenome]